MQTNVLVLSLCLVVKLHYYAWDFLSIFKKKRIYFDVTFNLNISFRAKRKKTLVNGRTRTSDLPVNSRAP